MFAKAALRRRSNLILDFIARYIDLWGCVKRNDRTRLAANVWGQEGFHVSRTDKFMKHGDGVVAQLIAYVDLSGYGHPILRNGIVFLSRRLQPQVVNE